MSKQVVTIDLTSPSRSRSMRPKIAVQQGPIIVTDGYDSDVIFVTPENYSPAKKQKKMNDINKEIISSNPEKALPGGQELKMTYFIPGTKFPHSRENCTEKKFLSGFINNDAAAIKINKEICSQCYCFVCQVVATECKSWSTGTRPHCNGYSKNHIWEYLKTGNANQDFIFNCFLPEDGADSSCSEPTKWGKLLEVKRLFENFEAETIAVIPCFCFCHTPSVMSIRGCCGKCVCNRCATNSRTILFRDLTESLTILLKLSEAKMNQNLDRDVAVLLLGVSSLVLLPGQKMAERIKPLTNTNARIMINKVVVDLREKWIRFLVKGSLSKKTTEKLRESLVNLIQKSKRLGLQFTLQCVVDTKPWDVVHSVIERHQPHTLNQAFCEAQERFLYFKRKKKWQVILEYGAVTAITNMPPPRNSFFDIPSVREFLPLLLAKLGKLVESVILSNVKYVDVLPLKLFNSICGRIPQLTITDLKLINFIANAQYPCAIFEYNESKFKNLLCLLRGENMEMFESNVPKQQSFSSTPDVETLKLMMIITIRGLLFNHVLNKSHLFPWLVQVFSSGNTQVAMTTEFRKLFITSSNTKKVVSLLEKAGASLLNVDDLNCEQPFQIYALQVLVVLAVRQAAANLSRISKHRWLMEIYNTSFRENTDLSLLTTAQACHEFNILPSSEMVDKLIATTLPKCGASSLSSEIYTRWFTSQEISMATLLKLWKYLHLTIDTSSTSVVKGQALTDMKGALLNMLNMLIDNIVENPLDCPEASLTELEIMFHAVKDPVPNVTKDFQRMHVEFEFKSKPSVETFKALQLSVSAQEWEQVLARCCKYVTAHCRRLCGVGKCFRLYYELDLFKQLKDLVTFQKVDDKSYEQIVDVFHDACNMKLTTTDEIINKCHPWLSQILVHKFVCGGNGEVPTKTAEIIRYVLEMKPDISEKIISQSFLLFQQHLSIKICNQFVKRSACNWVLALKELCKEWKCMTEFSCGYYGVIRGDLKLRKKGLICDLTLCNKGDILPPVGQSATKSR